MSGAFDTSAEAAIAAKRASQGQLSAQRQREQARTAEAEDVVQRRKALATSGRAGRSLLIQTSERGVKSNNLGGTT